ncbi:MAG: hypothetical protein GF390_02125, partial [Candidatus Pacebacteria bacterium]|nr:hypothetical protein [Candidatus Paceibacterota bacterium]
MINQNLYFTSILQSFSTFLANHDVPATQQLAAKEIFTHYLKQKKHWQAWEPAAIKQFCQQQQAPSSLTSLLTQFVTKHPPYQTAVFLHQFLLALKKDGCSKATLRNYKSDIKQFFKFTQQQHLKEIISKPKLQAFARYQAKKGLKSSTITRKFSSLIQFALWLKQQKIWLNAPAWLKPGYVFELNNQPTIPHAADSLTTSQSANKNQPPTKQRVKALAKKILSHVKPAKSKKPTQSFKLPQIKFKADYQPTARKKQSQRFALQQNLAKLNQKFQAARTQFQQNLLPYLNLVLVGLALTGLGVFGYQQFFTEVALPFAYPSSLTRPNRILSFQGRLTDTAQTPVVDPITMSFKLYDSSSGGSQLWQSSNCSIDPDQDGIFTVNLGAGSGGGGDNEDCGSEIKDHVFTEYSNVWLEVTAGGETFTTRQPIRTVAYALNAETVQGYPASASAVENTLLIMDNNGEVVLGNANPKLKATGDSFTIEAKSLTMQTTSGSNGNLIFDADGTGAILAYDNLHAPTATISATYATGIALVARGGPSGSVSIQEWQDSAGNTLTVVDESGNIGIGTDSPGAELDVRGAINAGTNGTEFVVDSSGNVTTGTWQGTVIAADYGGTGDDTSSTTGVPYIDSGNWQYEAVLDETRGGTGNSTYATGDILYASGSNTLTTLAAGADGKVLKLASGVPSWEDESGGGGYWSRTAGVLSPDTTNDVVAATSSATTVATFTATSSNDAMQVGGAAAYLTIDASGNLAGTGSPNISGIGDLTAGGTITFSGLTADRFVKTTTGGELTVSQYIDLTSEVTGVLPLANGGTSKNITADNGAIVYSDADSFELSSIGSAGDILTSGGAGAPTWTDPDDLTGSGWFENTDNVLHPRKEYGGVAELAIGGTATASANFHVGVNGDLQAGGAAADVAYSRFGTGTTGHSLAAADDLLVTGLFEVDDAAYFDTSVTVDNLFLDANTLSSTSGGITLDANDGDVTLATNDNLNLTAAIDLIFGGSTSLGETTGAADSGAYLVGIFDEFANSSNTTVQEVINDLDDAIENLETGSSGLWTRDSGVISPGTTNDVVAATSSATTVATFTATSSNDAFVAGGILGYITIDASGNLAGANTPNFSGIGNLSAGGTITFSNLVADRFVKTTTGGELTVSQYIDLTSEVTDVLPLANGGTSKNITADNGAIVYSDADSFELSSIGSAGDILTSGGAGAPTWTAPGDIDSSGWFANTLNVLHPKDEYGEVAELAIGGTATASANFHVGADGHVTGQLFQDTSNNDYYLDPSGSTSLLVAGNVGIGTTDPDGRLHAMRSSGIVADFTDDGNNRDLSVIRMGNGATSSTFGYYFAYDGAGSGDANYLRLVSENAEGTDFDIFQFGHTTGGMDIYGGYSSTGVTIEQDGDIFTSGNVGIGTTAPINDLHILGADPILYLQDSAQTASSAVSYIRFMESDAGGDTEHGFQIGNTGDMYQIAYTSDDNNGAGSYSDLITVLNDGSVGIINDTPSPEVSYGSGGLLDIDDGTGNGTLSIRGGNVHAELNRGAANRRNELIFLNANTPEWYLGEADSDDAGSGTEFFIGESAGGANAHFWIESGGNTGIGTTSPDNLLEVAGSGGILVDHTGTSDVGLTIQAATSGRAQITLENSSGTDIWRYGLTGAGSPNFSFYDQTQNALILEQNGDILMNPGGNVGIGATSPATNLDIELASSGDVFEGGIKISRGGTGYLQLIQATSDTSDFVPSIK